MPTVNLTIDKLQLHSGNPRFGSASSQRDALQKIIDDQKDKLAELAESIVTDGMSPIERILVLKDEKDHGRYVVLEGNRRAAALKILSNPAVLASLVLGAGLQKRLAQLAKEFDRKAVEPLACFEVSDDSEATKWVYLRHTGENDGRGVVRWSGLAAARFRGDHPALQALEFVREHGNLDVSQRNLLVDGFPITTLDRLLSTKEVRSLIGVEIKNRKLRSRLHGDELIKPLRRMVLDLAEKRVNVSHLKNRDSQVEYIKTFAAEDKPNLSKSGHARDVEDFKSGEFKVKASATAATKRAAYDPSLRKTVVPRGKLNITVSKISEIYRELRTLHMDDNPHACAVLLRVFLELSVDHYLKAHKLPTQSKAHDGRPIDKKLTEKVREVVDHLVKSKGCNKKDFMGISRSLTDLGSPLHINLLHAYVHSAFVTPKVRELRSAWDEAQPLFDNIWA